MSVGRDGPWGQSLPSAGISRALAHRTMSIAARTTRHPVERNSSCSSRETSCSAEVSHCCSRITATGVDRCPVSVDRCPVRIRARPHPYRGMKQPTGGHCPELQGLSSFQRWASIELHWASIERQCSNAKAQELFAAQRWARFDARVGRRELRDQFSEPRCAICDRHWTSPDLRWPDLEEWERIRAPRDTLAFLGLGHPRQRADSRTNTSATDARSSVARARLRLRRIPTAIRLRPDAETRTREAVQSESANADYMAPSFVRIVTPGSDAGELLLLRVRAPLRSAERDLEGARATLDAAISMVLRLIGREGDPGKSREHAPLCALAEARLVRADTPSSRLYFRAHLRSWRAVHFVRESVSHLVPPRTSRRRARSAGVRTRYVSPRRWRAGAARCGQSAGCIADGEREPGSRYSSFGQRLLRAERSQCRTRDYQGDPREHFRYCGQVPGPRERQRGELCDHSEVDE
jgi:hypothetical protein